MKSFLRYLLALFTPAATNTIDVAFVKQFESEVHLAYQRFGAHLLGTVRRKDNVKGYSTTFQIAGKGVAGTKTRNGQVPIMNIAHSNVECILVDRYAGEYIDKLDELKVNHDERMIASKSIAGALGRASDLDITAEFENVSGATSATSGITLPKIEEAFEALGENDVPDDGQRYLVVSPQGWTDLMGLTSFSDADYVGQNDLPYKGYANTMKHWFSFYVFMFSGLTKASTQRTSLAYHKSAMGHASGADITLDITWQGKEQANLAVGSMSRGAKLIDTLGAYKILHTES